MAEVDDNKKEIAVFNYGKFKVMLMANTYAQAQSKNISGDYEGWFRYMRALKNTIKGKLSDEQLKDFTKLEEIIVGILSQRCYSKSFDSEKYDEHNKKIINLAYKYIDLYDTIINRFLDNKGFDNPTKTIQPNF
jgi:hypothetical protein